MGMSDRYRLNQEAMDNNCISKPDTSIVELTNHFIVATRGESHGSKAKKFHNEAGQQFKLDQQRTTYKIGNPWKMAIRKHGPKESLWPGGDAHIVQRANEALPKVCFEEYRHNCPVSNCTERFLSQECMDLHVACSGHNSHCEYRRRCGITTVPQGSSPTTMIASEDPVGRAKFCLPVEQEQGELIRISSQADTAYPSLHCRFDCWPLPYGYTKIILGRIPSMQLERNQRWAVVT
jgi:hypothetical protein